MKWWNGGLPTLEPNTNANSPTCWTSPQLVPIYFFLDLPSDMLLTKKHGHSKIPGLFVLDGCKKIFFFFEIKKIYFDFKYAFIEFGSCYSFWKLKLDIKYVY